jgi:hypothetical protein
MKLLRFTPLFAVLIALTGAQAQHQPYAGQHAREIKALSEKEVRDLLEGAGMGYAKAAELNHYPGPAHALDNAAALGLSLSQREALEALMKRHKSEARELGAKVVRLERELDALFAERRASAELVDAKLAEIASAQARLRGSHLKTHLEAAPMLTAAQTARYEELRGYAAGAASPQHRH